MPKTKSWRDLGFDLEEPPDVTPNAEDAFWALPDADRLKVMGPRRIAALNSGKVAWADLSSKRSTAGWRDSYGVTPLRDLAA
jgi:hypothetical protein